MKKYLLLLFFLISCKNASNNIALIPPISYEPPVIQPLKFDANKNLDLDTLKTVKVKPIVKNLNWNKLPERSYDTVGVKPFKYPVEEKKFDYNALPSIDLDINKLPSHAVKFKTYILPQPKLIKGAKLHMTNENLFVLGFGEEPGKKKSDIRNLFQDLG